MRRTSPFSIRPSKKAKSSCLQQPFRQARIVREVGERDLRLDHPELGEVEAGVRVLGAEVRPEGVDLGQCHPFLSGTHSTSAFTTQPVDPATINNRLADPDELSERMSGPALAQRMGFTPAGLQLSLQLVGRPFAEATVLRAHMLTRRRRNFREEPANIFRFSD